MNIAFDFIVLECYFCHVLWLEMGQSLIYYFYIMPQTGYAMFTLFALSYNST